MAAYLTEARDEMAVLRERVPAGTRWKHIKSGHDYMIHGHVIMEATLSLAITYSMYGQTEIWCRPAREFLDGRFERLTD